MVWLRFVVVVPCPFLDVVDYFLNCMLLILTSI